MYFVNEIYIKTLNSLTAIYLTSLLLTNVVVLNSFLKCIFKLVTLKKEIIICTLSFRKRGCFVFYSWNLIQWVCPSYFQQHFVLFYRVLVIHMPLQHVQMVRHCMWQRLVQIAFGNLFWNLRIIRISLEAYVQLWNT